MNPDSNVSQERIDARADHAAADALIRLGNQRERLKTLRLTLEQQVGRVRVFAEGIKPHAVAQDGSGLLSFFIVFGLILA